MTLVYANLGQAQRSVGGGRGERTVNARNANKSHTLPAGRADKAGEGRGKEARCLCSALALPLSFPLTSCLSLSLAVSLWVFCGLRQAATLPLHLSAASLIILLLFVAVAYFAALQFRSSSSSHAGSRRRSTIEEAAVEGTQIR